MFLLIQLSQNVCLQYCIMFFKNSVLQCSCAKYIYFLFKYTKVLKHKNLAGTQSRPVVLSLDPFYLVYFRYGYHRKCYQKYTHKQELQRFEKKSEIEEAENRKSSQNSSFSGLICNRLHFLIFDCCHCMKIIHNILYFSMFIE